MVLGVLHNTAPAPRISKLLELPGSIRLRRFTRAKNDRGRERVRSGMRNAAAKGVKIGRPQTTLDDIPANFLRHYPQYKKGAFNLTELARLCDISRTTAYKYIGLLEG